jgi:tripartite-type tricarboxylate transporter receptor subunit TctC
MIKNLLIAITLAMITVSSSAQQIISIAWPYSMSHGATALMIPLLEEANRSQNQYNFILESKPGVNGQLALNHMNQLPALRMAVIAPAFVQLAVDSKIREDDYRYLVGLGEMCFAVWMKNADTVQGFDSIKNQGEITVGNVAWGNASHLIALTVAEKYNMKVRNIVFKSNREGLLNLAQDGGVTLVVDRPDAFNDLRSHARTQAYPAAVTCNQRLPQWPNTKTLKEQGINADAPWLTIIANKEMPAATQKTITAVINRALITLGEEKILEISSLHPVIFQKNKDVEVFYKTKSIAQKALLQKYQLIIDADRGVGEKK